jgi:hypothetical protein
MSESDAKSNAPPVWRRPAIAAGGLALAVLVAQSGLGTGLSGSNPTLAKRIDSGNSLALGVLSDRLMKSAQSGGEAAAVRRMSEQAVLASPMEAAALRNLGFLTVITKGEDVADPILSVAGKLSKRDYFTHAWLLDRRFRAGQVAAAVDEADIVLRQRQTSWPVIIPELVRISGDPRLLKPMTIALARKPSWRSTYLDALGRDAKDLNAVYAQLRLLKASEAPPVVNEMRSYFARFDGSGGAGQLWSEWTALSPPGAQQGLLRDGSFNGLDAPPPFNWTLYPQDGVYSEFSDSPVGGGKALYVSYEGDRKVGFAQQMLRLAPGSYQMKGRVFADEPVKDDQLAIVVGCGSSSKWQPVKYHFIKPQAGDWKSFTFGFTIKGDCAAQQLMINGELGDFRSRAAAWVDDLVLVRTGNQPSGSVKDADGAGRKAKTTTP